MRVITLLIVLLVCWFSKAQAEADKLNITAIPEFPKYEHDIYAGYLNITPYDKAFYYVLCKSQQQQEDDPVVLWLNGGPGCSSLMGMVSQHGPFLFQKGQTKMNLNDHAWNKKANIIYLESPAGVGFSQGQSTISNDSSVAKDNYLALVQFFERFQNLRDNNFYLAGESYAGIYIPTLAAQIIQNNQQQSSQERKINLKGVLLGNACTDRTECYTGKYLSRYQVEFMYTRGFVDTPDYSQYKSSCVDVSESSASCLTIQQKIHDNFYASMTNIYNVYDVCYPLKTKFSNPSLGRFSHALHCSDAVGSTYLFNKNQYRPYFHVLELNDTLKWTPCSDSINYTSESRASYYFLRDLVKYGLKIWYFSGDFDAMVPIQGTLAWLQKYRKDYGAAVKKNWRHWTWGKSKLGGMIWQLEGITFLSVIGAGHMVPSDKPEQAQHIFHLFLEKEEEKEIMSQK